MTLKFNLHSLSQKLNFKPLISHKGTLGQSPAFTFHPHASWTLVVALQIMKFSKNQKKLRWLHFFAPRVKQNGGLQPQTHLPKTLGTHRNTHAFNDGQRRWPCGQVRTPHSCSGIGLLPIAAELLFKFRDIINYTNFRDCYLNILK